VFDGERLVGFNTFIAHDFLRDGRAELSLQSYWAATDPEYRGRGVWPAFVEATRRIAKARGAARLFGFPNEKSRRPYEKVPGHFIQELVKVNVPLLRGSTTLAVARWPSERALDLSSCVMQNDAQLVAWKRADGRGIVVIAEGGNLAWGVVRTRRFGPVRTRVFAAGGLVCNNAMLFPRLLRKVREETGATFAQFVMHPSDPYRALFRRTDVAPRTEPYMSHEFHEPGPPAEIHVMAGAKDVF
jgi:hypothetical protein